MSSISYAITVWNEHKELDRLLTQLKSFLKKDDEIVVQMDDKSTDEVKEVVRKHGLSENIYSLNNDFSDFKNNLKKICSKEYIFQIDADELLSNIFLTDLNDILKENEGIDGFQIPRINVLVDEAELSEYINNFKWENDNKSWLNYPDSQFRLFKNNINIFYVNRVHETLLGCNSYLSLENRGYHIIHIKSIQRQSYQNQYYRNNFDANLL
jgi:GT2 family glycosyltransferase